MSAYIYAIIPYKIGDSFCPDEGFSCIYGAEIPALKGIVSEFADPRLFYLYEDFLLINTCYRQSAFTERLDGYSWLRAEISRIAKALGASEVWYVEELVTEELEAQDFSLSYEEWVKEKREECSYCMTELTVDVLKGDIAYGFYHDDFSDLITR